MHHARIRTSTGDPLLRLLYVGVALVLRNVWAWLHGEVLSCPRRGGRRLDLSRLTFRGMLLWLQHYAERWLGDILTIAWSATLSGAKSFEDIAAFGRAKATWLRSLGLTLPPGTP